MSEHEMLESARQLLKQAEDKAKQNSPAPSQSAALVAIGNVLFVIADRLSSIESILKSMRET